MPRAEVDQDRCVQCNLAVPKTELSPVVTGVRTTHMWCHSCRRLSTFTCAVCGKVFSRAYHDATEVDDKFMCDSCRDKSGARECECCGTWSIEVRYCDYTDSYRCDNCWPDDDETETNIDYIYAYHGFPRRNTPVLHKVAGESTETLFMGFELEAGDTDYEKVVNAADALHKIDPDEKRFHMEEDESIWSDGFELISAPHTLKAHKRYSWDKVLSVMRGEDMKSAECDGEHGLHVHVSRAFVDRATCVKLDAFISRNKEFWIKLARRNPDTYAKIQHKDPHSCGTSDHRYQAVNFCPSNTVEFRLFNGTLNHTTLLATLELVDATCRWVKSVNAADLFSGKASAVVFTAWMSPQPKYKLASTYVADILSGRKTDENA